jgi:hypothetical protein
MITTIYQILTWCITCCMHRVEKNLKVKKYLRSHWIWDLGKILQCKKIFCRACKRKPTANSWVCRASTKNSRQTHGFVVILVKSARQRFFKKKKTDVSFVWVWEQNTLSCVMEKTHGKQDLCRAFLSHPIFRRKPNASHMCARITISHIW